jgi:hypothetical protein
VDTAGRRLNKRGCNQRQPPSGLESNYFERTLSDPNKGQDGRHKRFSRLAEPVVHRPTSCPSSHQSHASSFSNKCDLPLLDRWGPRTDCKENGPQTPQIPGGDSFTQHPKRSRTNLSERGITSTTGVGRRDNPSLSSSSQNESVSGSDRHFHNGLYLSHHLSDSFARALSNTRYVSRYVCSLVRT